MKLRSFKKARNTRKFLVWSRVYRHRGREVLSRAEYLMHNRLLRDIHDGIRSAGAVQGRLEVST